MRRGTPRPADVAFPSMLASKSSVLIRVGGHAEVPYLSTQVFCIRRGGPALPLLATVVMPSPWTGINEPRHRRSKIVVQALTRAPCGRPENNNGAGRSGATEYKMTTSTAAHPNRKCRTGTNCKDTRTSVVVSLLPSQALQLPVTTPKPARNPRRKRGAKK